METFIETAPGIRLFCQTSGQGPQTVLIPLAAWTEDFEVLARGRRVIRYDPRGRGKSSAIQVDQASFDNDLADLEAVRNALGLDRVALIGWSYFGGVVARYAMLHPERVERFVTVGGMPIQRAGWMAAMQQEYAARMAALPQDGKARSKLEVFRATRMGREPVRPLPDFSGWPNERMEAVMPLYAKALESMGDWDWRADAAKLQVPALIVGGDADLCAESAREWATVLPNARLLWMDRVGHFPMFEDPERFFTALDEYLTSVIDQPSA